MTLNDSLSDCSVYDEIKVRHVKVTFWNVENADLFLKNHKVLIEYLESISQYKINEKIVSVEDVGFKLLQVRVKCPDIISANLFMKNLEIVAKKFSLSVVIDKPSVASRVNDHLEEIRALYCEMARKVSKTKNRYVSLVCDLHKNSNQLSLEDFQKKRETLATYEEKIREIEDHEKEFDKSQIFVEKSLGWFLERSVYSEEEIKRLMTFCKREIFRCENALPIYARKSEIVNTIMNNQVTILIGETGSGKTTQLAQYIYEAWPRSEKIIACTQPRKVAAVSVAERVSEEMKCNVGDIVGYQVGMSKKSSGNTRILFMTDHILLNECLTDGKFSKYSCIILDEAHERSIFTDLLLGFIKKAINLREDLKVVITSATIDPTVFKNYFRQYKPPKLEVSGRIFPVDVIYETPSNPKDHVRSACDLVVDLHSRHSIPGDILVFLTSPAETEEAVKILKNKRITNGQILQLHGRLQLKEQQEVLRPTKAGLRKIVFATNAAETSVTIPGIKYVIDTGLVREMTFDGSKNMSSLVLTKVTKSSANQRKGRAGRTEPGKCYRLFSRAEYDEMKANSVPEILRVHLGQALLKLMLLGIKDPKEFDFVEAPSKETMNSALDTLVELDAIDDQGITALGKKLATISLEPRLGKVILMGVDQQLGFECVVTSALCATGSQIFFRGGESRDKITSDRKKALFCDDCGDMATLLNVYKKWITVPEIDRSRWCGLNYINSKKINGTKDLIRETLHCLRNELRLHINETFSERPDVNLKLSRIIFDCYYSNLAMYTGHRKIGFRLVKKPDQVLQIHPSSSLTYLEHYPNWIVFESILTTSETFLLNTTFIKQSWVDEKIERNILKYTQQDLERVVLDCVKLDNLGSYLHKIISSHHGLNQTNGATVINAKRKNYLESHISSPDILTVVDIDEKPFAYLYASMHQFESTRENALSVLKKLKVNLFNETVTKLLNSSSNVKGIIGSGALIQTLLMPNECSQILIKMSTSTDIFDQLTDIKRVSGVTKTFVYESNNEILLTFSDPEMCSKALKLAPCSVHYDCQTLSPYNENSFVENLSNITVKVLGVIRKAKYGFINFKSYEQREQFFVCHSNSLIQVIYENFNYYIRVARDRKNDCSIYMSNLHDWIDKSHIEKFLEQNGYKGNVKVVREKITYNKSDWFKSALRSFLRNDEATVNFLDPKPDDNFMVAYVKFEKVRNANNFINSINSLGNIKARFDLKFKYSTPQNIYDKIRPTIDKAKVNLIGQKIFHDVKTGSNNKSFVSTTIEAESLNDLVRIRSQLDSLLSGYEWRTHNYKTFSLKSFPQKIRNVANANGAYVLYDDRKKCLTIYGTSEAINRTKTQIDELLNVKVDDSKKEIDLRSALYSRGLTKNLIRRFGFDLATLKKEIEAVELDINLKLHRLIVYGPQESYDKLESILRDISAAIELDRQMNSNDDENRNNDYLNIRRPDDNLGDCKICLDKISFSDYYVTEYCGHVYCKDCITSLIKNNSQEANFPIKCIQENCNAELVIKDFQNLITNEEDFQVIVEASFKYFQSQNSDKYFCCPSPDCPTVIRKAQEPASALELKEFICGVCQHSVCMSCGSNYHRGTKCAYNAADETLKSWIDEDNMNRSICPKCSFGIEKNGGCNHMTCSNCKTHICWFCKMIFNASQPCYDHMRNAHGGIGI